MSVYLTFLTAILYHFFDIISTTFLNFVYITQKYICLTILFVLLLPNEMVKSIFIRNKQNNIPKPKEKKLPALFFCLFSKFKAKRGQKTVTSQQ